jgi:hypothetical protein
MLAMTQAERIISRFPNQNILADAIGVNQSTVAMWKKRGFVPVRQQSKVLDAARKLKVKLKPQDFFSDAAE